MPRHKTVLIALFFLATKAKRRGMTGKLSRHTRLGPRWGVAKTPLAFCARPPKG
jgi:hypothetical protein